MSTVHEIAYGMYKRCIRRTYKQLSPVFYDKLINEVEALFNKRLSSDFAMDNARRYFEQAEVQIQAFKNSFSAESIVNEIKVLQKDFDITLDDYDGYGIIITTPEIHLEDGIGKFNFGRFKVSIYPPDSLKIYQDNPHFLPRTDISHPFIRSNILCAGDGQLALNNALANCRFTDVMDIIMNILTTYDESAAYYQPLEKWYAFLCARCANTFIDDHECSCGCKTCPTCTKQCVCGQDICDACLCKCDCGAFVCHDCASSCKRCGIIICQICATDNMCFDCHNIVQRRKECGDELYKVKSYKDFASQVETKTPIQYSIQDWIDGIVKDDEAAKILNDKKDNVEETDGKVVENTEIDNVT